MSKRTMTTTAGAGRYRWVGLLSLTSLLAACAAQSTDRDLVVERPMVQGEVQVSADNVFEAADIDRDDRLDTREIETLGLGGNWHTLDADGSGLISRQEFRDQFASRPIQSALHLPGAVDADASLVSSDYRLPPEPPTQRYRPAPITSLAPTSMTLPSAAPLTIPVLLDDSQAAAIDRAANDRAQEDAAPRESADEDASE
ncbi:EF-hand domain-containing protein [Salinicola avicenniae]|uniref:EF-hand domain-containing protein n=1 Tax=Salinicola avicenniae TaxID=2916836 RepID=UPI00207338FA|nr:MULTISPECIES: EF-hand domain-containing protein [unclassified Salinicola]